MEGFHVLLEGIKSGCEESVPENLFKTTLLIGKRQEKNFVSSRGGGKGRQGSLRGKKGVY